MVSKNRRCLKHDAPTSDMALSGCSHFFLGLHGILLLIIFSEYRRNPPPSQIEWFDLREMTLTPSEIPEKSQSASAISAVPKKQEMVPQEEGKTEFQTKTKELPTVIIPPAKTQNPEGKIETMVEAGKTEANALPNKKNKSPGKRENIFTGDDS
ncbi:MAG: hypothetical protein CM15mP45_15470 [Deltaproteobacteria bacterium]|nr:MAG: hypothetical protein CM15mP45_15470 [Deltaproteobacteria bacterium]